MKKGDPEQEEDRYEEVLYALEYPVMGREEVTYIAKPPPFTEEQELRILEMGFLEMRVQVESE